MKCEIEAIASPGVQGLKPYQPGKPIEALQREYNIDKVVKLASNENPVGPSPKAVAAIHAMKPEFHLYPDGAGFLLKEKLAECRGVHPSQITLGNGSDEIFNLILKCFVQEGQEVVISQYAFAAYAIAASAQGARLVEVPANDWGCDLDALLGQITTDTRVVFIANPNNPTGTWVSKEALQAFLKAVPSHVLVVIDQAYFEYMQDAAYPNAKDYLDDFDNLIVTYTFSKAYGLAGLRVGYSLSSGKIADYLNRVRLPFNVNQVAQVAAIAALDDNEHLQQTLQTNQQGMLQLRESLGQLGLSSIEHTANFLTVKFSDAQSTYEKLLRKGVIVRPLVPYGMTDYLRITVGLKEENDFLLEALTSVV